MRRTLIVTALITALAVVGFVLIDGNRWRRCETPGSACCFPDPAVNTEHCHQGLGCNVTTGKCAACGAPGQPCCDGDFTGFSRTSYGSFLNDPKERIESCDAGASCDARLASDGKSWLGTRICRACGSQEGGSCCPPDVRYALGRCFDTASGKRLTCNDPFAGAQGSCVPCGHGAGVIACQSGYPCVDGLVEENGLCVFCGLPGMPPCDRGEPCRANSVPDRFHTRCVPAGGKDQPCLPTGDCSFANLFCNAKKICEHCGSGGETCCPPARGAPCELGDCVNNRCFACGYQGMPVCAGNDPCPNGGEPVGGFCRACGKVGQPCCRQLSILCEGSPPICRDGTCRAPAPSPGPTEQWKTCSGQPYTLFTLPRVVWIEDSNSCAAPASFIASSPEEALQCALGQHGEAVIRAGAGEFAVSVACPHTGCAVRTYRGRDYEAAKSCAEATALGCDVLDSGCP